MGSAEAAILAAAAVAGVVAGLAGVLDRRRRVSRAGGRRLGVALLAAAVIAGVAGTVVYVAERGSPFTDIAHAWNQFKTKPTPHGGSSRLGRLGSDRYDFWRVAWGRFRAAPVAGIGADNFQEAYLRHGKSHEQPLYPHSVELRTLSQTGLVGALLLGAALVAALVAAAHAAWRRSGWGSAAAAGAVGAFAYWFVHGSVDWFWEFPALGGAAFALLGLAAGLAPRRAEARPRIRLPLVRGPVGAAAAALAALVVALSFAAPALSLRYQHQAADIWRDRPGRAHDKLDIASSLNPLSPRPKWVAGNIALNLRRPVDARRYFREAADREPRDPYSYLMLGAIATELGRPALGERLLARAAALEPRDPVATGALRRARRGRRVDVAVIRAQIAARYARLGR
jgi:O-antigen ligase